MCRALDVACQPLASGRGGDLFNILVLVLPLLFISSSESLWGERVACPEAHQVSRGGSHFLKKGLAGSPSPRGVASTPAEVRGG